MFKFKLVLEPEETSPTILSPRPSTNVGISPPKTYDFQFQPFCPIFMKF